MRGSRAIDAAFEGNIMVNIKGDKRSGRHAGKLRPGFEEIFSDISNVQYEVIQRRGLLFSCETVKHRWRSVDSNIGQIALLSSFPVLCYVCACQGMKSMGGVVAAASCRSSASSCSPPARKLGVLWLFQFQWQLRHARSIFVLKYL